MILNQDEVNLPKFALSHPTGTQDIAEIGYFLHEKPSKELISRKGIFTKKIIILAIFGHSNTVTKIEQIISTYDTVLVLGIKTWTQN